MKKTICALLVALLLFPLPVLANARPPLSHAGEISAEVERFVAAHADNMAAASVAVFTHDDVLFMQSFGYLHMAQQAPNHPEAVFEWGSVTKLLVPVAVFQLVEQGLLDMDRNITEYLPAGFLTGLRYNEAITMRHLLSHTAGFQEVMVELFIWPNRPHRTLEEALRVLQPPQIFRPGEVTAYSNFGLALAGYIVEVVAGQPFHQYVHENIFTPLGMARTALTPGLNDNPWVRAQRQHTYTYAGVQPQGLLDFKIQWYPAGMATGTIEDFARFGMALLPDASGASPLFAYPGTLAQLFTPTTYFADGVTGRNYNGFMAAPQFAGHVIGHGGNTAGMSAYLHNDIQNGLGVVILTNQAGEQAFNAVLPSRIFGVSAFAGAGNPVNNVPVDGVFRMARGFEQGPFRLFTLLTGTMPVSQLDDGALHIPLLGQAENVAEGVFLFPEEGMFPLMSIFVTANENGQAVKFSMPFFDFVRISTALAVFEAASFLLMLLAGLYGLGVLIRTAYRKLRKKNALPGVYARAVVGALLFVHLVCMALFFSFTMVMLQSAALVTVFGILFILLALAATALSIFLIIKQNGRAIWLSTIMVVFMVFGIIYWQLWAFWV